MKFVTLLCVVVVVVEGRPQAETRPQGLVNIADEYLKFHQLWLAEAKRNSIAPVSPYKTRSSVTEQRVDSQPKIEVEASAPATAEAKQETVAAQPKQETTAAVPEAAESQQVQPAEGAPAPPPDMNAAFAEFHTLWKVEAARNAIAPTVGARKTEQPATLQVTGVPVLPVQEVVQVAAPQEAQASDATAAEPAPATPDYQAEFARFQELWQQEAARNAIAPVFQPQPVPFQPVVTSKLGNHAFPVPAAAPKALTPVVTPAVVPSNLFSGFGGQPIIVVLPNWTPATPTNV